MVNSLQPLFQAIATAPTEQAMRYRFMDGVSEYFGVQRWGVYLLGDEERLASFDVIGVSDAFVERYEQTGSTSRPICSYRRAKVSETPITSKLAKCCSSSSR